MEQQPKNPLQKNPGVHSAMLAAVGGYLVYLAYQILTGVLADASQMSLPLAIVFAVLFALAGLATIGYAARLWKRSKKGGETHGDGDEPSHDAPAVKSSPDLEQKS